MTPWTIYSIYLAFALGGVGLYFLMPKGERSHPWAGAVLASLGLAALLGVIGVGVASPGWYFHVLAAVALAGTGRVITHPKPVYGAINFVLVVLAVAAMCLLQQAEFVAVALIIIYAGAILVTYIFVIMLARQEGAPPSDHRSREPFFSICAGFVTMAVISASLADSFTGSTEKSIEGPAAARTIDAVSADSSATLVTGFDREEPSGAADVDSATRPEPDHNSYQVGVSVMTRHVVALQIGALLLLVAMVGAVAMSRKRVPSDGVFEPQKPLGQAGREVEPF